MLYGRSSLVIDFKYSRVYMYPRHRTHVIVNPHAITNGLFIGWWFYFHKCVCVCANLLQSCTTLCNPRDHNPPGSCVHGILQARTLKWVAISYSRGSSWPRDWTQVSCGSCIAGHWATGLYVHVTTPPSPSNYFHIPHSANISFRRLFSWKCLILLDM